MGGRYFIIGSQIGVIKALLETLDNKIVGIEESNIIAEIEQTLQEVENQFIGNVPCGENPDSFCILLIKKSVWKSMMNLLENCYDFEEIERWGKQAPQKYLLALHVYKQLKEVCKSE